MAFKGDSYRERMVKVLQKAADAKTLEGAYKILEDAITNEIATTERIENMPGYRDWLDGPSFDLAKAKARR